MPEYTPEESRAFIDRGLALAKKFDTVVAAEPEGSVTYGTMITACASLFASRAKDQPSAEKLAKDLAVSVMSLYQMRSAT